MTTEINLVIDRLRTGSDSDREDAFFALVEIAGDVLPAIIDAFRSEPAAEVRTILVKAAWERRESVAIPCLAEALYDEAEEVWQEALDGLVTFASPEALDVLQSARSRKFAENDAAKRFHLWLEEAIQQVLIELRAKA